VHQHPNWYLLPFWVRPLIDYIEALKCLDFNSETLNWCKLGYSWILTFFTVVPLWVLVYPRQKSQCIFFLVKTTQNGSEHRCQRWGTIIKLCQNPFDLDLSTFWDHALIMLDSRKKEISVSKGNCHSGCIIYQALQHDTQFIKILCTINLTKKCKVLHRGSSAFCGWKEKKWKSHPPYVVESCWVRASPACSVCARAEIFLTSKCNHLLFGPPHPWN
jgi:hypothetical protein